MLIRKHHNTKGIWGVSEQLLLSEKEGGTQGEWDLPSPGPVQKLLPALPLPLLLSRLFRWASSCSFQNLTKVNDQTTSQKCLPKMQTRTNFNTCHELSSHLGTVALSHHPASALEVFSQSSVFLSRGCMWKIKPLEKSRGKTFQY